MRILVTGGTGFIGRSLVSALVERGDAVSVFSRNVSAARERLPPVVEVAEWTPERPGDWQALIEEHDAVVHLAGEGLIGRWFTDDSKRRIFDSRVKTASLIVEAIARARRKPEAFVSASGIGYYGVDHGIELLDEADLPGKDFLAELCVEWERAALGAEKYGVRVVNPRIGVVVGPGGGVMKPMLLATKLCLGAVIGSGEQVVSWVHLDDLVAMLLRCVDDPGLSGPVNLTAPQAVTHEQLARALGRALRRPVLFRIPGDWVELVLGEGAVPILGGQRVIPRVMQEHGYEWRYPELSSALEHSFRP